MAANFGLGKVLRSVAGYHAAQAAVTAFRAREATRDAGGAPTQAEQQRLLAEVTQREDAVPAFLNGRLLRDYQTESLKWMMGNFRRKRNCILGDEMVRACPSTSTAHTFRSPH